MRLLAGGHGSVLLTLASVLVVCAGQGQRDLSKLPESLQDVMPGLPDASTEKAKAPPQDSQFATPADAAAAMKALAGADERQTSQYATAADAAAAMKKQAPASAPAATEAATAAPATDAPVTAAPATEAPATAAPAMPVVPDTAVTGAPVVAPVTQAKMASQPATPTPTPTPSPTPSPTPTPPVQMNTPHEDVENNKDQFPNLPGAAVTAPAVAAPYPAPTPPAYVPSPAAPAPAPMTMPADCDSAVCLDSAGAIDPDCCDPAGTCSGDQFSYTQGGPCTNGDGSQAFKTWCRLVQAPGPAGPAVLSMTTEMPASHKGAAIGLGVVGGAAALAGIGVGIAHLVGNSQATTTLTIACEVGATELQVADQSKYKIGDSIEVGYETQIRKILGFGSLILDAPLTVAVPAGGSITYHAQEVTAAPIVPGSGFSARVAGTPFSARVAGLPTAAPVAANSSSDWSGSGSHMTPSSGSSGSASLNSSSTNNVLAGFLVVCLLCAVVGICAGVFLLIFKKRKDRAEYDQVHPQYEYGYTQPQGMQVPHGFGYAEGEGQPLMSPHFQPQMQMGTQPQMQSYQMQRQNFQHQQPSCPMTNIGFLA